MLDTRAISWTFDAGMNPEQATAVTNAVHQAGEHGDHATRQNLEALRADSPQQDRRGAR